MTHKLFSSSALRAFENFLRIDAATKHLRPKGAVDAVSPELRRALARDQQTTPYTRAMPNVRGGDNGERLDFKSAGAMTPQARRRAEEAAKREKEWAEERAKAGENDPDEGASDEGEQPDPDSIRAAVECIREAMGDEAAAEFVTALHQKWPGIYGEWNGEGDNDLDTPDEAHTGTEGLVEDDPLPFKGMPRTGGTMVGDAALSYAQRWPEAARIGIANHGVPSDRDSYGRLVEARASAFDNYGRRLDGSPPRGSKSRAMAMDRATPGVLEEGYFAVFPDAARIKCL